LTLLGVLSVGVLEGILVAVLFSLLLVISRISRPHSAVLGTVEGIDGYHDIEAHTSSETVPGLIAYRFDAPLLFANADYFLTQVRELIAAADPPVECLVIDAEAIIDIDVTAVDALKKLYRELERKGIKLGIARASQPLQKMLDRSELTGLIGSEHMYPTIRTAIQAYHERKGEFADEAHEMLEVTLKPGED
jgi:SulP family sulfate permease